MVIISIKQSDGDGFLFETTTDTLNDDLISSLVDVHNGRLRSRVLIDAVRGLAAHGPMKNPQDDQCNQNSNEIDVSSQDSSQNGENTIYEVDPTGIRVGIPPETKLADTLLRVAQDLEDYIDKAQIQKRINLTYNCILEKISNVRGAVMMAYPMGLPEWDIVKVTLDSVENNSFKDTAISNQLLEYESTTLWVAGKEFQRGKLVSDRLGHNEKTKVIGKLEKEGSGPPAREPMVSEEERQAMMAYYFKRQEELKRLSEADDDDYLNSQWADNKQMKRNLQGLDNVKAPGLRF